MPDIIIQSLGSMEAGMQFCRDNALSITDTPVAGNTYLVSELAAAAGDLSALQYLDQHDVVIGTLNLMPAPPPPPVVYSRSLTIDHTQCGGSDSVDFPV